MDNTLTTFPTLYKRAANGKTLAWTVQVEDRGTVAAVVTLYGEVGGAIQESVDLISEGKNLGKKNETTYWQQAVSEASARWTRQRDRKRYSESLDEIDHKKQNAPMLAQSYDKHAHKIDWRLPVIVQPKLDGFRCLATKDRSGRVSLRTREGKPVTTMGHIVDMLEQLAWPDNVDTLDGELYVHDVPFQSIASLIKRQQENSKKVAYWLYDLMSPSPVADRVEMLGSMPLPEAKIVEDSSSPVLLVESCPVSMFKEIENLHEEFVADNFEGAIVRHGHTGYEAGKRSYSLLKYKHFDDDEFVVQSIEAGKGPYSDKAILTCCTKSGKTFAVTAPGTLEAKSDVLSSPDQYIGRRVTVKYQGFSDDGIPRFPVAKSFR